MYALCIYIYVCLFAAGSSYLLLTPDHAMMAVGSDVSFTCRSSIPHGVSWYFKSLVDGLLQSVNETLFSVSTVYGSDNQTSILKLRGVEKQMSGTYKCADANDAAFADLTVLSTFTNAAYVSPPPPPPRTSSSSSSSSSLVFLEWPKYYKYR